MPASGVFALNRSADFRAPVYGVEFLEGGARNALARSLGGRFYFAEEVLLRSGRAASYAVAEIPIAAWEESAPAIAGVKGGPLARLKLGARARAYVYAGGSAHALLVGSVVSIRQDLEADGAAVTILDDRWLLEGVPVAGQFLWDDDTQSVLYRPKGPCRGRPNCLDGPDGPLFAPWPGYGRTDGDADPAPGQAAEAARPWRHADICSYLRRAHATALYAAQTAEHPYFTRVDDTKLVVPEGFGLELLNDADADPAGARAAQGYGENDREDASGSARTPDLALEGLDLLAAFSAVVESAGAYALSCSPEGDGGSGRSILEIVPARYVDGTAAARVYRPGAGSALSLVPALSVTGGGLEEDAEDLFTAVAVAGEPARLEVRLAYSASGGGGLEPAWSAADEAAFRTYMAEEAGQPNSRQAFFEAAWKFPRVFAAYRVEADYDLLADTKYAARARATAHPAALPDLLTLQPGGGGAFPFPVSVELKSNAGTFAVRSQLDGLQVDDDGTLWLPGLREASLAQDEAGTWKGRVSDPEAIVPRELRMTLALDLDERLVEALALPNAGLALPPADPNGEGERIAPGLRRTYWADAGGYREHLRLGSWPVPQSVSESEAAEDRAAAGEELASDGAKARAHAQRRLAETARARRRGRLVFPRAVLWKPGAAVEALVTAGAGRTPVRGVVSRVRHLYRRGETEVEME